MNATKLDIQYDDESKKSAIVYVDARVNEQNHKFVLDTGCRTTSLMQSKFSEKLVRVGENVSSGAIGTEIFDLVEVDQIEFGPLVKKSCYVSRSKTPKIDKNLLGMDVLKGSSFVLSYKKSELNFNECYPGMNLENISPDPIGHQPYINIRFQGQELKVLWDTGAGITLVDINFIKKYPNMFELAGESMGTDSTGNSIVTSNYKIKPIEINGHLFDSHEIAAIDMSHVNSKSGNPAYLTLGFSTIRQADWFFDFGENKWSVVKFHGGSF